MTKKHRRFALLVAICVFFVMLFSTAYIAGESDHNCTGDDCTVCCHINTCEQMLKTLTGTVTAFGIAAALTYSRCILQLICQEQDKHITLVSLKVKLSD